MPDDLAWWTAALNNESPAITESPQAGFFKRRLIKGGPWVPVQIWVERQHDDAGDLIADEIILCTVDGREAAVDAHWTYACAHPITEAEFDYLARLSRYAKAKAPREPLANPRKPIDPLAFPLPALTQKKGKRK